MVLCWTKLYKLSKSKESTQLGLNCNFNPPAMALCTFQWLLHVLQTLALATSSLMFFVSRDRFSMDLESATLELMVKLLSTSPTQEDDDAAGEELERMQARIQDTCQHLQNDGCKFDVHIDEVSVSTGVCSPLTPLA